MNGIAGKTVLVTGASSGIGEAIAHRFAQEGATVVLNYRSNKEEAEKNLADLQSPHAVCFVEECEGEHMVLQGDVSVEADVERMVAMTVEKLGGIDILVNNAGIQEEHPSDQLSLANFEKVLGTNLRGSFLCAREALKHFLATGKPGCIINISSVHERIPKPGFLGYSVSKGGMGNLTRTLALEYAGRGIRVNAIAPGAIITPINQAWIDDPEKSKQVSTHIPMGRPGEGHEVAAVTAFLASDEAAYITGQTLYVDGGLTLYPEFRENWSS